MLINNIGNRERIKTQILYLQVMQQGTRANLCTFANCRLLIPLPVSRALRNRLRGEGWKEGRDKNELYKFSWVRPLSQQMKISTDIFY